MWLSLELRPLQGAQEWAALPVLAATHGANRPIVRGQSFYEHDGLNHALINPAAVEAVLIKALARGV